MTENVVELTNVEAAALDLALERAIEKIASDPTVAAYLQRFPVEDQDRALRDRIIVKLGHWAVEDWPARLGRLSGGVFFGNDPSF